MKKLALAVLLALPFTAIGVQKASAWGCGSCGGCGSGCGGCTPTYRIGFSLGLCCRGWAVGDNKPCAPCPPSGGPCGLFGNCCNPFIGGYGPMPPWYQFYPGGPGGPSGIGGTSFPTPAPTGYPYGIGPQSPVGSPLFGANFNNMQTPTPQVTPCGFYPQSNGYYYGR